MVATTDAPEALSGGPLLLPTRSVRRVRGLRPAVALSVLFLVFIAVAAIVPSLLTTHNPLETNVQEALESPSISHPFGTDENGRDVYARVIYGARQSMLIGIGATALGLGVALVLGLISGLGGRFTDGAVNRLLEVLFSFPVLLLALIFVAIFGPSVSTLIVAVGLGSAPGYARLIRGQILTVKGSAYVEASYLLGNSPSRTISRTILPNAMRPLVVLATLGVGQSIVWAAALSFLGLGVAPPNPDWGAMLYAGRDFIQTAWWLTFFPGLIIVAVTLSTTGLGRYLQRRLEGRLEG